MLKNFVEYLLQLGNVRQEQIGSQIFTTQPVNLIRQPTPDAIVVRNLSGLVDYLKSNYDNQPPVLVHVESPTTVNVYSTYNRDMQRNVLLTAKALLPEIPFKQFMDAEQFNILLQSCFVPNEDRASLLAVVGNIQEQNVATVGDDGVSQQVTAKTGVATLSPVLVPNPVHLKPFRTFVEIEQPRSQFIFRMRTGPQAALFEADGGAWKLDAIHAIKVYLQNTLIVEGEEKTAKQYTIIG
jgi:hypothetical protein